MKKNGVYFWIGFIVLLAVGYWFLQRGDGQKNTGTADFESGKALEESTGLGVSSSNPVAVEVGMDILEDGGTAVDAAIAISYALGVVEPHASGIGGGGGMLILPGDQAKEPTFFDYRETSAMSGRPESGVGIPGFVQGMADIHEQYGTKKMADLLKPSIKLAENGFPIQKPLPALLKNSAFHGLSTEDLPNFYPNGRPLQQDDLLVQPELADTLKLIKKEGPDAFYQGQIGKDIAGSVAGLEAADFNDYTVLEKKPVYGEYLGYEVITAPPPFSGITLIQSLQMAEIQKVEELADDTIGYMHTTGEIFKRTYRNRIKNLGDPDFVDVPVDKLTSMAYSKELAAKISTETKSDGDEIDDADVEEEEVEESVSTTHFVVTDKEGTVVSVTNTLGHFFGTGLNVDGFFLNGGANMFSGKSTSPNSYAPGKRSRTFTAPTILRNDDRIIGIGTPGGTRIPLMLTQVLVQYLGFEESLEKAIETPRFSFEKNTISTEYRYPAEITDELNAKGYDVEMNDSSLYFGGIQSLVIDKKEGRVYGGADPRRGGTWQVK